MEFEAEHVTSYAYAQPVAEAYLEARLHPPDTPHQTVLSRELSIEPSAPVAEHVDWFGNRTEFFSLPWRHAALEVTNRFLMRTHPLVPPEESLAVSVDEARQIFASARMASAPERTWDYRQHTDAAEIRPEARQWARRFLGGGRALGPGLLALNHALYRHFSYASGSTEIGTSLRHVWRTRRGVCQDFAHVLLSIVRAAGLPARYVCGYIETDPPPLVPDGPPRRRALVGAAATHAWVEVLLPGLHWWGLDPTNDKPCDDRHLAVSYGRDYADAAPIRGTFKGGGKQGLRVSVRVRRLEVKSEK